MGFWKFGSKKVNQKVVEMRQAAGKLENKDAVEGAISFMVGVSFADGSCDPEEIAQLENVVKVDDMFADWQSDVPAMVSKWIEKFKIYHRGAVNDMEKELADLKNDPANAKKVLLAALSVADNGGIGDAERAFLEKGANVMGLRLDSVL